MADPTLVTLAWLESEALARALKRANAMGWAKTAMSYRAKRFAAMPACSGEYERRTELTEGLAHCVELRALGRQPGVFDPEWFPADVRRRCYWSGAAIASLLDRFAPNWEWRMGPCSTEYLDELLSGALADPAPVASISGEERERIRDEADRSITAMLAARRADRDTFLARSGPRLKIVAAPDEPLRVSGFDPMNVAIWGRDEVWHGRYLELGNAAAVLTVLDGESLTRSSGDHPLFDGVYEVVLTGLTAMPVVMNQSGGFSIETSKLRFVVERGTLEQHDAEISVRLARTAPSTVE